MKNFYLVISLVVLSGIACAQKPYEISKENVTRIISTLASDDMKGRATFSPELDKAADFLAGEFKSIGLQPMKGEDDFLQDFSMYSVKLEGLSATINGKSVDAPHFIRSSSNGFSINSTDAIRRIGPDDNFRVKFSEYSKESGSILVLVDKKHKPLFGRYAEFFGRGSTSFKLEEGGANSLWMVYSKEDVTSVDIEVSTEIQELGLKNVAGMIPGKRADEYVLFSAHYDHIGIRAPVKGDSIANGANDDASGTTAVVELARYFKTRPMPERTLLFVAFTAEESGGFGSRYFSEQLDPDEIVAMFNIEMIGKPAVEGPNTAWITGFDKSSFGELMQKSAEGSIYTFYPDPYPSQNLFYRSDNATLARLGVPAHSISTTPIDVDKDYHQVTDHVETLNLDHLTNTIKAIAAGAVSIVSGKDTPTRVDPATVD